MTTSTPAKSPSCVDGSTARARRSRSRPSTCSSCTCADTRGRSLTSARWVLFTQSVIICIFRTFILDRQWWVIRAPLVAVALDCEYYHAPFSPSVLPDLVTILNAVLTPRRAFHTYGWS
jgi:hypothetical protein